MFAPAQTAGDVVCMLEKKCASRWLYCFIGAVQPSFYAIQLSRNLAGQGLSQFDNITDMVAHLVMSSIVALAQDTVTLSHGR